MSTELIRGLEELGRQAMERNEKCDHVRQLFQDNGWGGELMEKYAKMKESEAERLAFVEKLEKGLI